jgi:hypothetical protein
MKFLNISNMALAARYIFIPNPFYKINLYIQKLFKLLCLYHDVAQKGVAQLWVGPGRTWNVWWVGRDDRQSNLRISRGKLDGGGAGRRPLPDLL